MTACCTHAVLSGKVYENLANDALDELIMTDTIPYFYLIGTNNPLSKNFGTNKLANMHPKPH